MAEISKLNIKGTNYEISDDTARSGLTNKADKTSAVSNVTYDTTNKKLAKTINGTTTDIVTASQIVSDGLRIAGGYESNFLGGIRPQLGLSNNLNTKNIYDVVNEIKDLSNSSDYTASDIYHGHLSDQLPCITNSIYTTPDGHLIVNLGKMAYAYIDSFGGMGVDYAYMNNIIINTNSLEYALDKIMNYNQSYCKSNYIREYANHIECNLGKYIAVMYELLDIAFARIEALESYSYGYSYSYSY